MLPSYELARRELAADGLSLNGKEVYRIADQLGAEILTTRTRVLESNRAGTLPALAALTLSEAEREKHYRRLRHWLRAGRASDVLVELSRLAQTQGIPLEAEVWSHLEFLEKHTDAGRTRYATFRRRGIPLGSGAIESAIRRVINLRLKGNGITWYEENAEAMAAMRAAALTDRWAETLEHVRETMATNRRLEWQWRSPDLRGELNAEVAAGSQLTHVSPGQEVQRPAA